MRISYNWLKEYVDVRVPAEKLAELLTMAGLPVESIEEKNGDRLMEIEVTANRSDCLSVIGIAREVGAITGRKLKIPSTVHGPRSTVKAHSPQPTAHSKVSIKVEDKTLCPRYTGRVIQDVRVGGSPVWLKAKIEAMGLRSVNNIVDITNFCLFETGEPMHAFDLDKVKGGQVIVRRAKKGEKIVTIDGLERTLDDTMLVIADAERAIAIAGVMGGLNTEVTASTRNILLEAAYFDPVSVRRTGRKLTISTESSYRFERNVDMGNILYSSERAAALIRDAAGGNAGKIMDTGKKPDPGKTVTLRPARLSKVLGLDIPAASIKKILGALGIRVRSAARDMMKLTVPGFRCDLNNEVDIIEEVARIYGYDKMPVTIPPVVEQPVRRTPAMMAEREIRDTLACLGFTETITYSLLSRKELERARVAGGDVVEVQNPLSGAQEVMRPSLLPGMLNTMVWNMNRKEKDLRLFEIGNVYTRNENGFVEKKRLSLGITGEAFSNWTDRPRSSTFFDVKGPLEKLLCEAGAVGLSVSDAADERFLKTACANIEIRGENTGVMGELSPKLLSDFDIKERVYFLEADLERMIGEGRPEKRFMPLPKYPSIFRDISIVVSRDARNAGIISAIRDAGGPILKETALIDRYTGKQLPQDKISLTYRLEYRSSEKTLEEKDVASAHAAVLGALENKFGARLR
ncbi:MAG: phenylalanine--tRNA ligase subunit beta [Candidatus Omnitrophota bacterium]